MPFQCKKPSFSRPLSGRFFCSGRLPALLGPRFPKRPRTPWPAAKFYAPLRRPMPLHPHKRPLPGSAARATAFFIRSSPATPARPRRRAENGASARRARRAPCRQPVRQTKGRSLGSDRPSWWRRVDSNHRRRCQQIYSLPPLATRELLHIFRLHAEQNRLELVNGIEPSTC